MGSFQETPPTNGLEADERWQLAQRIAASPPFHRAGRLRTLLLYLVEETLKGRGSQLTEQRIGHYLFGKPTDYSPVEDSSVRANARLLRFRLHEYFDSYGRSEAVVLDLPKGTYVPLFRQSEPILLPVPPVEPALPIPPRRAGRRAALLAAAGLLVAAVGYGLGRLHSAGPVAPDWPLAEISDPHSRTQVVLSDINYGLFCLLSGRILGLEEYIDGQYPGSVIPSGLTARESHLASYLARTQFVSYADAVFTNRLLAALGGDANRVWLRSARDLKTHDLADGNFLFVGSPASNPWVSLFAERLNFIEEKSPGSPAAFVNKKPQPGEQDRYMGIGQTGASGEDYATLALLPSPSGHGKVLILQGLQQEGTEAAGLLILTDKGRAMLRSALKVHSDGEARGLFFEALIRSRVMGGSAAGAEVVATRIPSQNASR